MCWHILKRVGQFRRVLYAKRSVSWFRIFMARRLVVVFGQVQDHPPPNQVGEISGRRRTGFERLPPREIDFRLVRQIPSAGAVFILVVSGREAQVEAQAAAVALGVIKGVDTKDPARRRRAVQLMCRKTPACRVATMVSAGSALSVASGS